MREDKRKWMTEKAQAAQTAAENGEAKELYDITRQLRGRGPRESGNHQQGWKTSQEQGGKAGKV